MKAFSKLLFFILGVILLCCLLIVLNATCPPVSSFFSNISKQLAKKPQVDATENSSTEIDIEMILSEIEARERKEKNEAAGIYDLGLIDDSTYTSLDSYYSSIVNTIKNNYKENTEIIFLLNIDSSIFHDWYAANYRKTGSTSVTSYSFNVEYSQNDDGSYQISHRIKFY